MFAQVIQGRTTKQDALRQRAQEWDRNLKSGAEGFLGSTSGVAENGEFIAVVRFESEEAARRNSDRPEQGEWWAETQKLLEGEARFYDSTDVESFLDGGSDDAGFVQVIQGTAKDRGRLAEILRASEDQIRKARHDVIGGTIVWQGNDFTEVVYFTSEDDARAGEKSDESQASAQEWMSEVDNMKFIDLRDPYFSSP
jgi:hypothetical protein